MTDGSRPGDDGSWTGDGGRWHGQSVTAGRAGGMRKAPKRGRRDCFMSQSADRLLLARPFPAARMLSVGTFRSLYAQFLRLAILVPDA